GKTLSSASWDNSIKFWETETGREVKPAKFPDWVRFTGVTSVTNVNGLTLQAERSVSHINIVDVSEPNDKRPLCSLIPLGDKDWIVTTPVGQFDTSKALDRIEGLHWVINDEILRPLSLEIFMRQYYEPGLLSRLMRCNAERSCAKEFK